jgi:phenylalanine-4-hydroxylase
LEKPLLENWGLQPRQTISAKDRMQTKLVALSADHPGFNDLAYRARRNLIAQTAIDYQLGNPVPEVNYTPEEQGVWRAVWEKLAPLHKLYACRQYLEATAVTKLPTHQIPQLVDVNSVILPLYGFKMLPVAGLVAPRAFLEPLADGVFLSTQYIRHPSRPFYTPEPDIVHELVGHAATFAHPDFAELNRAFGRATMIANNQRLEAIARLYWYTLEFGVVKENDELRVYGAGLLSSFGELEQFAKVQLKPFDLEVISETPYDPTTFQKCFFVAPNFPEMAESLLDWLKA